MKYSFSLVLLIVTTWSRMVSSAEVDSSIDVAVQRGLGFLSSDALKWKSEHQCSSCHHASMIVWAMVEAKKRGHAVDEPVLTDLTKWIADSGEGKTGVPRPAGRPKALNTKAVYYSLALAAIPNPDDTIQAALQRLRKTVKGDQADDGS